MNLFSDLLVWSPTLLVPPPLTRSPIPLFTSFVLSTFGTDGDTVQASGDELNKYTLVFRLGNAFGLSEAVFVFDGDFIVIEVSSGMYPGHL